MQNLKLNIKIPTGVKPKEVCGQLVSLLSAVEEVGTKSRKASYIVHFFQERLNRKERRELIMVINQFQISLQSEVPSEIHESKVNLDTMIVKRELQILQQKFAEVSRGFSESARIPHQ